MNFSARWDNELMEKCEGKWQLHDNEEIHHFEQLLWDRMKDDAILQRKFRERHDGN